MANNFAAGYMSTAEYKNAPLLIAGGWIGWLRAEQDVGQSEGPLYCASGALIA